MMPENKKTVPWFALLWFALGCACCQGTEETDPCRPDPCHGHGTCSAGSCGCASGYAGDLCDTCATGYQGYPECQPVISFAASFGGGGQEWASSVLATGNGYLLSGFTDSSGAGKYDFLFVVLDERGDITWQKTYGLASDEKLARIRPLADGFLAAGVTASAGSGLWDILVMRTDLAGEVLWQRTYGGPQNDLVVDVQPVADGFVLGGFSSSFGAGRYDYWLLKIDPGGEIVWQKAFGGPLDEMAFCLAPTEDGILVGGSSMSFGEGGDGWLVRVDASGEIVWQKAYGGAGGESVMALAADDTGYIAGGLSDTFGEGRGSVWLVKLDRAGNIIWQKAFWGSGYENLAAIRPLGSGYILAGSSSSAGAGQDDFWLVRLDGNGEILWQKTYGGAGRDFAMALEPAGDGLVLAGYGESFGKGQWDLWLLRLDENGDLAGCANTDLGRSSAVNSAEARATAKDTRCAALSTTAASADVSIQEQTAHIESVFQCGGR